MGRGVGVGKQRNTDWFPFKFIILHLLWVLRMSLQSCCISLIPPLCKFPLEQSPLFCSPQTSKPSLIFLTLWMISPFLLMIKQKSEENNLLVTHHQTHQYTCTLTSRSFLLLQRMNFSCPLWKPNIPLAYWIPPLWNTLRGLFLQFYFSPLHHQPPSAVLFSSVFLWVVIPLILTTSLAPHSPHACLSSPL